MGSGEANGGGAPWGRVALVAVLVVVGGGLAWAFLPSLLAPPPSYAVRVSFPTEACWTGSISVDGVQTLHEGCGVQTLEVMACMDALVAIFDKGVDEETDAPYAAVLTVTILQDEEVVAKQATGSASSKVAVSFSCSGEEIVM